MGAARIDNTATIKSIKAAVIILRCATELRTGLTQGAATAVAGVVFIGNALSRWEYIVGYLPDIWKFGLFPTFNAAKIVLITYLDNIFGLQSHTKSLQSKKSIFTLMGSHIDNSENSIFMSFNDKKIIYEAFWMFKTLYLMVQWSFVTLEPEKINKILIFQFVPWLCLCDVIYMPLKVFGHWGHVIFGNNNFLQSCSREGHLNLHIHYKFSIFSIILMMLWQCTMRLCWNWLCVTGPVSSQYFH